MGDKSFETDFSNDGFFLRKQIQIDTCTGQGLITVEVVM